MRFLALLCAIGTTLAMRTKCAQDKLSTVDDARRKGGWASMSIPDDCEEIILSRRFHLSDPPPPRPGRHGTPPGEKLDDAALTARVEAFARAIEDRDEDSALEVLCDSLPYTSPPPPVLSMCARFETRSGLIPAPGDSDGHEPAHGRAHDEDRRRASDQARARP